MIDDVETTAASAQSAGSGDLREYYNRDGRTISLDSGLNIGYRDDWLGEPWKEPTPVLMLHGNQESGVVWYGWVPLLGDDFRLIRPDLPGFGHSSITPDFQWKLADLAEVMAEFLDKLRVSSAHIVAAKTGGAIALQFAARYPRQTRSLVLATVPLSPVTVKPDLPSDPNDQSKRLGSAASKGEIDFYNKMGAATQPQPCLGLNGLLVRGQESGELERLLPQIKAPTLVMTSDRNAMVSVSQALANQQAIQNGRLSVITSDAYHIILSNTREVASNVGAFLKEVDADHA